METDIHTIVEKLIVLGEDADELRHWESIYGDLPEEGKKELLGNLQGELQELLVIENGSTKKVESSPQKAA